MDRTPSEVGARAELEVAAALLRSGRHVYLPLMRADGRIDMIFEDANGRLVRAQCKTSRVKSGVLTFAVCSHSRHVRRDYRGEIDVFGVYSPELDAVFIVPVDDVATRLCHLRLAPTRNGQAKGIRWAEPYRLRPLDARNA